MNNEATIHKESINDTAGTPYQTAGTPYQIVKYAPAFKEQIAAIQCYLWGPDVALNIAYLEWKYNQNPYIDEPLIYLALWDNQVVGMLGSFGMQWEIDQATKLRSLSLADLVVEPAHRNRQLFPALIKFALADLTQRGYPLIFDLTASPEVALVMLMNGWRSLYLQTAHLANYQQVVAPQERLPRLRAGYRQLRSYAKNSLLFSAGYQQLRQVKQRLCTPSTNSQPAFAFDRFDQNQTQRRTPNSTQITVAMTPRPAEMAAFLERLSQKPQLRHVRDENYFTWRFQNPLSDYRFLFWGNPALEGYLVLQTKVNAQADTAWVNIVDWEASNAQVQADLLHAALTWGEFKEVEIWSATLGESAKRMLEQAGFRFCNRTGSALRDVRGERVMFYSLQPEQSKAEWAIDHDHLLNLTNWDIRMVYSDAV